MNTVVQPLVEVRHVAKTFGGVRALHDASLTLYPGEVHALLGENGAGKSTLLKALAGVHRTDAGEISVAGRDFEQGSTRRSREQGIAVIYQEPGLFPDLSLAENVFVSHRPTRRGGAVDWVRMRREAAALFTQLGVDLNPDRRAEGLSIADQQIVEIAKALSAEAHVIVMDEPTAALSASEADRLLSVARRLRDSGAAVVFVSHRLDEVFVLCDRFTVMRDGSTVGTGPIAAATPGEVVRQMVGRELTDLFPKVATEAGDVVLSVRGLTSHGVFEDVSFQVRSGEIVAFSGLVGSGRSEVVRAVFGIDGYDAGEVEVDGRRLPPGDPREAMRRGVALVPEDRRQQGLFMPASIARNTAMAVLGRLSRHGLLRSGPRDRPGRGVGRAAAAAPRRAGPARRTSLRRQPAEGRAGQVAGHRAATARHRRAHARHRRQHQGRGAPSAVRAGRAWPGRPDDLQRAPRGSGHGRPRPRDARRKADSDADRPGGHAGAGHARRDRSGEVRREGRRGPRPARRPGDPGRWARCSSSSWSPLR